MPVITMEEPVDPVGMPLVIVLKAIIDIPVGMLL
jgi:hypothetical protein